MTTRPPAVAGRFFSADRAALRGDVARYIAEAAPAPRPDIPRAVIAPHAGYVYSGPIAGSAFATLATLGERLRRVVLIGPSHHVAFDGIATSTDDRFTTPLGDVVVDRAAVGRAQRHAGVRAFDAAHAPEHSLETHLPFLQAINPQVQIIPLLTGRCDTETLDTLLDELWTDDCVLCVSSDLSHFEDYATATAHDARTASRIEALNPDVGPRDACGATAIGGLLRVARARRYSAATLDVRNSGDTAGGRDRVVGYGAFAFWS